MMHHPNMHHQPMSGHPQPQHLPGHRGMSAHHAMPPLHGENRHVTLTRVSLGPGGAGGGMGAHAPLGGLGAMPVAHAQRHPHAIRAMPHHPPAQHHSVPPQQMKGVRRGYVGGGGYGGVMHAYTPLDAPPHAPRPPLPHHATHAPLAHHAPLNAQTHHQGLRSPLSPALSTSKKISPDFGQSGFDKFLAVSPTPVKEAVVKEIGECEGVAEEGGGGGEGAAEDGGGEEVRPPTAAPPTPANSKEKTPMCLVNELARYNKIKHQYRLTSETGPAHKKVFTVTLRLGDNEEYTAEGSSIKRAQHGAAAEALAGTGYPAPPPRPAHTHPPHQHNPRHSVMPTVELNALAMKLCQPAVYTSVPPVPMGARPLRARWPLPRIPAPQLVYRVRVAVGGRAWLGEGATPQGARHDAAARALHDLRAQPRPPRSDPPPDIDEDNGDPLPLDVKSPVSLVHELALKRNLSVTFTVKSERGPPHMRVFITICTVGDMETEGEGNGKKISKRRAAEKMLEEMRRRWPPALLRPRPQQDKRRHQPTKKKPRNLIKVSEDGSAGPAEGASPGGGGGDNPISVLAVARHAARARSPQYRVVEERGAARRREFLVQCLAPPHAATGLGPNKKTAKRRAAHNVLLAMEMSANASESSAVSTTNGDDTTPPTIADTKTSNIIETKRKESDTQNVGAASSDVRQPVPGVLLMDYHQRSGQPAPPNGVSETSASGGSGGSTPGAKDQLMYLSQLLGFTVQFSDFPKRNHGEYLSLVSLSTEPPVMCHGGGPSTAQSHEVCSRAALRALALMGLDTMQSGTGPKAGVITNGISE